MNEWKGFLNMMRQALRSPSAWAMCVALALLAAYGCGTLENKGSSGENSVPELFIVNIPPDGSEFAASPTVYWYGTDSDGQITRYDYAVVLASEVDSVAADLPGNKSAVEKYIDFVLNNQLQPFPRWISIFVDSVAAGELPTQEDVRLFASRFPAECDTAYIVVRDSVGTPIDTLKQPVDCVSDTIPQYFFLRAIDDQDSSSQIKYRTYKRRNHWPETTISARFDRFGEYISLKRLTATYGGIELTWGGTDRLDFIPPAVPLIEYHWRLYGPFPFDNNAPDLRPTLADTLGRQPIFESANPDPLVGVWVRDTTAVVYDLWRQVDSRPDPLNDTTVTRSAYFMFVVTARDDAFILDETPAVTTFKTLDPKFERKLVYVDDTWYGGDALANPSARPTVPEPGTNQNFYWNLVKLAYPEADTMQDFWWRSKAAPVGKLCSPSGGRVRCGNFLSLELLVRHKMCLFTDDDVLEQTNPPVQVALRRYLEAGGMVWFVGRHSLLPESETCQSVCRERLFDFCSRGAGKNILGCEYFDMEGMYYPAWRGNAIPIAYDGAFRTPSSNDEFVGATLVAAGSGLPASLEIDPERVDSTYVPAFVKGILTRFGTPRIVGVPDVNFLVLGSNSVPLYIFESWRPGGPIPPTAGPSFSHHKPVAVRRVGPDRVTPLYKTCYMAFPLYFIKQEQSEELFRKMVDWFFLPFSQS